MVIVKLQGGLGNQMFQYAFGLSASNKLNTPLYLDLSFFAQDHGFAPRKYELGIFNIPAKKAGDKLLGRFFSPGFIQKVFNKVGINKTTIYRERSLSFSKAAFEVHPPAYFEGFFQSEQYFTTIANQIRKVLTFNSALSVSSKAIAGAITQQPDAISVHVRRGDYISSAATNELHGTCSIGYYQNAITLIRGKVKNPAFYFFSDDPDWVREHLVPIVENATLVHHNKTADSWQDMALMSKCKHHIIANSSFSWWGAWLNPNEQKIVIAPKKWFNKETEYFNPVDIAPSNWIRISND